MRVFEEKQQFRQWWFIAIFAAVIIGFIVKIYRQTKGFTYMETSNSLIFSGILTLVIITLLFRLELKTKIGPIGITTSFNPIPFSRKQYNWPQIEQVYVRKYSAVTEFGGWGIKGWGKSKSYTISGNYGIQIVTKQNKKFLIGTQKHEEAEKVLARYKEKLTA